MGHIVPEDWHYAEIRDETTLETTYVFACSEGCRVLPWQKGPGRLEVAPLDQQFLDVATHTKEGTGEHTILVSDGDTVRLGSIVLEVCRGGLRLREGKIAGDRLEGLR